MSDDAVLTQILAQLKVLQVQQQTIQAKVRACPFVSSTELTDRVQLDALSPEPPSSPTPKPAAAAPATVAAPARSAGLYPGRVNLTTYPDQHGITPYALRWGAADAETRGPVICSRLPSTIKHRNAIGAHSGSYSIYRALSIAMGALSPTHVPDYSNTEPPVSIPPQPAWSDPSKIVSLDPWGHLVPSVFERQIKHEALDVRPSIAVTKAHLKMSELDECVRKGELDVDGKIVVRSPKAVNEDGSPSERDTGVEVLVSKAAVEPVWYLPGVAERFGISESLLRRALFEDTGGMYPELITRPDIKIFLPPIGGLTVYICASPLLSLVPHTLTTQPTVGNPAYLSDESKHLTLRVHDECNGSDVFGSDICTCKPYLTYAILESIRTAQQGGVGLIIYFRKEGRALGEVTKYLVYNSRKRAGDSADRYFKSTEVVAGVKDMRFQVLMPDVLHWLGEIRRHRKQRNSNHEEVRFTRYVHASLASAPAHPLTLTPPTDHLIPPDSRVEIDAKIAAGYFSSGKRVTQEDLVRTVGRGGEDAVH
ncbi:hypothetical protein C0989_007432 [Termitomyces sp. Mn162]|nr:hypothetical protein C0989_007432 [Termitomyces sp. Mn162]